MPIGKANLKISEVHLLAQAHVFHQDYWFLMMDNDPNIQQTSLRLWMDDNMPSKKLDWRSQSPDPYRKPIRLDQK